ncbi:MAG: GTPase Era [Firmicutes bacterium]|nr:GTPase Era [Bacillota bacterium]
MFVSGFVSVIGRPNVGKSTLINSFLGQKLLIVSDKPQTTRNRIHAILTTEEAQVIFLDTPGIHKPRHRLGNYMVKSALGALKEVELIIFMVEATSPPGPGDRYIAALLQEIDTPVFLVINKMDLAPAQFEKEWLPLYLQQGKFAKHFPVSALQGKNLNPLLREIIKILPPGPQYYPPEMQTDRPEEFLAAEMIREKVLLQTREEIPHSTAVEIDSMELREDRDILDVRAVIYVERDSQKGIIIGKNGAMLKQIGTEARLELENLLGNPIFLDLWVKVKKDWRRKDSYLRQLGYE